MSDPKPNKKPQKLKARLPRGLADRGPAEIAATRAMVETIRTVFERYGFDPIETPAIEYTDALGKFLPDQDRPNEGVFSFQDDDEQWMSLRYDLTAPLARHVAENYGTDRLVLPYRSYRFGWVFRNEKPGPGRFRQFMQFDADSVGAPTMAADAEMCMLAADTMEALGIPRGSYVVKVWSRKPIDGTMDAAGVPPEKRLAALRAIDKLDRLGIAGVQQLLGPGRKDESGDFTKGADLSVTANNVLTSSISRIDFKFFDNEKLVLIETKNSPDWKTEPFDSEWYRRNVQSSLESKPTPATLDSGLNELDEIKKLIWAAGYSDRVIIDPSVVRGLEYYTGPVYEVELTFEINDDKGRPVRFGSVGGGGRYDGLVSRFMGQPVPATGFSIGVSRLQAALTALGKLNTKPEPGPVLVTIMDRDNIAAYQGFVSQLRKAKIRAELYLGNPKNNLGQQLKYADRRSSPCAIIQGSNEKTDGKVIIRDLVLGAELAAENASEREDYLKKQAEAQFSVNEADLVDAVAKLLTRHKPA